MHVEGGEKRPGLLSVSAQNWLKSLNKLFACWIKNKKRFACWIKKVTVFQSRLSVRTQKLGTKTWLKERFKGYLPFNNNCCRIVGVFSWDIFIRTMGCLQMEWIACWCKRKWNQTRVPAPATVTLCHTKNVKFKPNKIVCLLYFKLITLSTYILYHILY